MQQTAKLTVEQALNVLQQVTGQFKGTLQDHQLILQAYQVITAAINEPKINIQADAIEVAQPNITFDK
jgi:uncharacterized protein YoxC